MEDRNQRAGSDEVGAIELSVTQGGIGGLPAPGCEGDDTIVGDVFRRRQRSNTTTTVTNTTATMTPRRAYPTAAGRLRNVVVPEVGKRVGEIARFPGVSGFPAQKRVFLGRRHASFLTCRPGRGSKPRSVSGSIRLRALLDGRGNASSRPLGLAPGESAVSPYSDGASDATPSPYHRTVSFLLRSSDSRLSGSRPTPCFPERGLSSAAGRCRHGPPSAALHLLAR